MQNPTSTASPARPIKLYRYRLSGHSHRVELFLSLLRLPYELIDIDLATGAHRTPEFLRLNPFGQVPVIDDAGFVLADSNAILVYLAGQYSDGNWLPRDPAGSAAVQRWLSVAAGPIAHGVAAARLVTLFGAQLNAAEVIARGNALLGVMDRTLGVTPFLTGNSPTLAEVSCYSYTARAPEGNISLEPYSNVRAWLDRIEALPGFIPMPATKIGLAK